MNLSKMIRPEVIPPATTPGRSCFWVVTKLKN